MHHRQGCQQTRENLAHEPTPPVRLLAAAGSADFLERLFDRFAGFAGALLDPAQQFFLLAFDVLEIVIGKFGPLLFQLAFGDVPVAFDFKFIHNDLVFGLFDGNWFAFT